MNLNVFIAKSGFCSRRKATLLVKEGRVKIGGRVISEPWHDVRDDDDVRIGTRRLGLEKKVYLVFNKPEGVTTTSEDAFAAKKVTDFIPKSFGRVYPVGRLDKPSRGLIILTNDGELCHRFTHPKFEIEKEYLVTVEGTLDENILKRLVKGVDVLGDILKVKSADIKEAESKWSTVKVVVCEGKKRHLRRLFETLGFKVLDLIRIRIGKLSLGGLKEGRFRVLDKETVYSACRSPL